MASGMDTSANASPLAKILSVLPPSFPYLSVLYKAGAAAASDADQSTHQPTRASDSSAQDDSTTKQQQRVGSAGGAPVECMDEGNWPQTRALCIDKVSASQLRSWLEFLFLNGKQPRNIGAGQKLNPAVLEARLKVVVLEDCLATLPEIGQQGSSGGSKAMLEVTTRLLQLYGVLKVLVAAADTVSLSEEVRS